MPFRKLVKSFGAGLVFSEMIASRAMIDHHKDTLKMSSNCAEEFPMVVQLAGCDPYIMAEAAKMNEARGADIIDINMGCPVKKVVKTYAGSALMRNEKLAGEIMKAVKEAVNIPVTVKMRLGWDEENLNAPTLAKMAEDIGLSCITVHGRTRNECIMRLRRALDEMVVGGVETTLPLHRRLVEAQDVVDGNYDIHWLERFLGLK